MPKVTVIMTVYNKPRWLREAIDSVVNQTIKDWELIIMEDNSPDPQVKMILKEYENDSRISIYYSDVTEEDRYKTARYATLINEAVMEHSGGDYISYLPDDDIFYPKRLEIMCAYLDENPDIDIIYGSLHNIDADGNEAGSRMAEDVLEFAFDKVDHNAVMHRRKAFFVVGGWEDNYGAWGGADSYFWRRLNEAGYKFYPVPEFVGGKRYHENSVQWLMSNGRWPANPN